MTSRFEVGEIAVLKYHPSWPEAAGTEAEVLSHYRQHLFTGAWGYTCRHSIHRSSHPTGLYFFHAEWLRKRKNPPDWNAIAGAREREVV